jgi:hypothetical protein
VCGEGFSGSLGGAWTDDVINYDAVVVAGPKAERVALQIGNSVAAGQSIVALVCQVKDADTACAMWDDAGNTWTLAAEFRKPIAGAQPRTLIFYTNVTNALSAGDNLYFEVDCGVSLLATLEDGYKSISAWAFDYVLSNATESGNAQAFNDTPSVSVGGGDLIVAALGMKTGSSGAPDTVTADADWTAFDEVASPSASGAVQLLGGFREADAGGETWSGVIDQNRDWAMVGATFDTAPGSGGDTATFPPIWDVGPSSTEDGLQLLSGLRLYYGPEDDQYVYVSSPTTANQYSLYEESLHTTDPAINSVAQATVLANSILARRRYEERTYNVSIGPLNDEQIACIKPGQLIDIKARAIPDADDQYVSRRIAQLKWTTPIPGMFFAHMQLDRPIKDVPHSVGNKSAHEAIGQHVLNGSNSHPEFIPRALLTTHGDMLVRGASDVQRLAIGGSNTWLKSIGSGNVPLWASLPSSPGTIAVEDEGSEEGAAIDRLDFTGAGVSVTVAGSQAQIIIPGGGGVTPYMVHRLVAQVGNANTEMPINTTSYAQTGQTDFYHDWDLFPATHFRMSCFGDANVAAQTVTFQLAAISAPATPISSGGNDFVVTNGVTNQTTGWIAVASPPSGRVYMGAVAKGSTATVDFRGRWFDIEFKID